jgi:hypothetical protein
MVATRLPVRAAGSALAGVPASLRRRAVLRGLCAGVASLAGCQSEPRRPGDARAAAPAAPLLAPAGSVFGGFSAAQAAAQGTWSPAPGPFVALRGPIAAAARGFDLFIADAGHDAVFHYDVTTQQLRRLPGSPARAGVKLCVLGDRSVLILDPAFGRLLRLSREGRQLAVLQDRMLLAGVHDLAYDDASAMAWLADAGTRRLLAVRPAFQAVVPVPLAAFAGETIGALAGLAAGPDALYAIESGRSRVLRLDAQGRVSQAFGGEVLRQPRAIAADRHRRVYVADAADRSLHVFRGGRHESAYSAATLGASDISDLRVHDRELAIADAPGARVHLFRVAAEGAP